MPFDGNKWNDKKLFPYKEMVKSIQTVYPDFKRCDDEDKKNDTSKAWRVPGFRGKVRTNVTSKTLSEILTHYILACFASDNKARIIFIGKTAKMHLS